METRIRLLLLSIAIAACSGCASMHWPWHHPQSDATASASAGTDDSDASPPSVIEPQVERRTIKVPKIRPKDFEIGGYYGELSIQDFGAQPVAGARLDYHISEDLFVEATYGRAKGGKTSFELLSGNVQLLSDAERRFTYYNLSLGYNFLPGEVFIGRKLAMTSSFYLLAGIGDTDFAGDNRFTVSFGGGYRVLPTDWLSVHVSVEDHVFQSDLLGVDKLTNNLEATLGASVFF